MTPPPPINIDRAIECLGSEKVFRATVECFLNETDKMMAALEEAVEAGDLSIVRDRAHCVKGGLAYLHAGPSSEAAGALQKAAETGCGNLASNYHRLKKEVDTLKEALSQKEPLVGEA